MSNDIPSRRVYATSNMPWNDAATEPSPIRQMLEAIDESDDETRRDFYESIRDYAISHYAHPGKRHALPPIKTGSIPRTEGIVYYLRFSDRVKIGFSTNLPARLRAIPHDALLATEEGTMSDERRRHREFAELRVTGEWFRYEEPLISHIASLAS